jgi:ribosomal protein S16
VDNQVISEEDSHNPVEEEQSALFPDSKRIWTNQQTQRPRGLKFEKRANSLNYIARNNEVKRITNANEQLLKRLQNRGPTYNVVEWEHDRKQQIKDIRRICKYNPTISTNRPRAKSRVKGGATRLNMLLGGGLKTDIDMRDLRNKFWRMHHSKQLATSSDLSPPNSHLLTNLHPP